MSARKKKEVASVDDKMIDKAMNMVMDAIAFGTYQFLYDIYGDVKKTKEKRKKTREKISKFLPGIATCKHGVYECPQCAEERKGKRNARKNMPKS